MKIVRGSSTIIATSLDIGGNATVVIQPTRNGAAGLSTIGSQGRLTLHAGSTLELVIPADLRAGDVAVRPVVD